MTKFVRVIDTEKCMGCRACVAACHVENHYTPGAPWNVMQEREIGQYPAVRTVYATMGCMHCEEAPCIKACDLAGQHAITKNEYGVVLVDYDKCNGCEYCAAVCPYGAPQFADPGNSLYPASEKTPYEMLGQGQRLAVHQKQDKRMQKCTFCWHRLEPAIKQGKQDRIGIDPEFTPVCDVVCPVNARVFGDIDNPASEVSKVAGEQKAAQLKKEFGTEPQVLYVLDGGDY